MCGAKGLLAGLGIALSLALGLSQGLSQSAEAESLAGIGKTAGSNNIRVMTYDNPPFATEVAGMKQGLLIDLLDELFGRAGLSYELQFLPLKRGMMMAEHEKDICVMPLERSQERESQYAWIGPILISRYGLYSDKHRHIPLVVLEDAKPYIIGSYLGSGVGEYLQELGFSVDYTVDNSQNLKKLARKRIDLWASELISAKAEMGQLMLDLGPAELVFFTSIRAMACHPDLPIVQKNALESSLKQLYQEGFIEALNAHYIMENASAKPRP